VSAVRIWPVAALVFVGVAASDAPTPRAETVVDERGSDRKADERIAILETSVATLRATVDAQARQMHCFEVQRATRAAWSEHEASVLALTATRCNEVAGVCADTGLPPNTFGRYQVLISPVVGESDASSDTLRATVARLPELPQARVPSDAYTRIRGTRAAAENATKAYLAECGALDSLTVR
jgi:hypothetical protein